MQRRINKISSSGGLGRKIANNSALYLFLLPAIVLTFIFAYIPMYGIIIAFKDFRPAAGIFGSAWADPWYKHFERFFISFQFTRTIKNTLTINVYSLAVGFPIPIIVALVLNQMEARRYRKAFQTISYMPHFISTVVMVGMIRIFLSPSTGLIGAVYGLFQNDAPNLLGDPSWFSTIYVWSDVWQHAGWDSIIYIAALSSVDPALYEAAVVDGASRWQKLRFIDWPMILPTVLIMLILRVGNLMGLGFEKVYLLQNNLNQVSSEVISTYVYKIGILNAQYSYSTAINLFNTTINFILLLTINRISKRVNEVSLW